MREPPAKKNPALRRDFPALAYFRYDLVAGLLALIAALTLTLALTVRVLLLLAGLLPAALLLTGFLARVLILLTRILVLVRHTGISLVERNGR
jgi:hypothetical protein